MTDGRGRARGVGATALAIRVVLGLFARTCRTQVVSGEEILDERRGSGDPVVLSFWHEGAILAAGFVRGRLHRAGLPVTLLASQSRDGELVTRVAAGWGLDVVRGSASRGGTAALRGTYRAIVRDRSSPVLIPDGPRGPRYAFKVGVAVLAQMSQAPVLPLGFACSAGLRIRSWDRMVVPRPFSRIAVTVGEPRSVPRGLDEEEMEQVRASLEEALDDAARRAWESCPGGPRPARTASSRQSREPMAP